MAWSLLLVAVGLVLLMLASDRLVVAAVRLSKAFGISAVVIGALVVGLGTSMPELLVSALAASGDEIDVAMANVVGSNVANVTLVLGAAALIAPVAARQTILRREGALMLLAVVALAAVLLDQEVGRLEGGLLLGGMVVATTLVIRWSIRDGVDNSEIDELAGEDARRTSTEVVVGILALVATVYAANLLLDGALDVGERLGWSSTFLGLLLGVGTSLPELATAVAAARRSESDLVIGNVLGSNLFNSLAVAGTASLVGPSTLTDLAAPALVVMVATAVVAGAFSRTGQRIVRLEGVALVGVFAFFASVTF